MWSLEQYCSQQHQQQLAVDSPTIPVSTREFLNALHLPFIHPFCTDPNEFPFVIDPSIPPMGPLDNRFQDQTLLQTCVTIWKMVAPTLLAMSELWLRLFAGAIAPIGILYFLHQEQQQQQQPQQRVGKNKTSSKTKKSMICIGTVASSLVLMTDTLYVLEYGPQYGIILFLLSTILAFRSCFRHDLVQASVALLFLVLLCIHLVWDMETDTVSFGGRVDQVLQFQEGLYHDSSNSFIHQLVQEHWPKHYRTYSKKHLDYVPTPWMPTGDSRTGLPFLLHQVPHPIWNRVFLPTLVDEEFVALDFAFPKEGHDASKPMYLILHGLNGGSNEEYVRDFTVRRTAEGSTVVVMIARGLMDLPIRGWEIFHGARTVDAHAAALALQKVTSPSQILVGVGYSMGAIVMSNYVASYGSDCALDAAIAISGGLDLRFQEHFYRAQRLWQPMLAEDLRDVFLLGKWGKRVKQRLSSQSMLALMRASHVTEIDKYAVVEYHRFDNLDHYYREMSALGDIPHKTMVSFDGHKEMIMREQDSQQAKIHNVSIPFCVVHALDDPLISWRTVASNEGFMHPETLVKSGSGYLMLLLTKGGGHVGWPLGWLPTLHKWKWMSDVAMSFANAVHETKKEALSKIESVSSAE